MGVAALEVIHCDHAPKPAPAINRLVGKRRRWISCAPFISPAGQSRAMICSLRAISCLTAISPYQPCRGDPRTLRQTLGQRQPVAAR